jgi:hypothetical protein
MLLMCNAYADMRWERFTCMGCGWHVHCVCLACLMWLACALRGIFQPYHAASVLLDIQHVDM